jgi:hypothetical protein
MPTFVNKSSLTAAEIRGGIAHFKALFPDDPKLQVTPDSELLAMVQVYMTDSRRQIHVGVSPVAAAAMVGISPCVTGVASVIVDVIFMALGFVGLHVSANEAANRAVLRLLGQDTINGFMSLFHNLNTATTMAEKAKGIWSILGAAYNAGMVKGVLGAIKDSMEWWDWVITGVAAVAQIVALVATDGVAFIAEIALNTVAIGYVVSDSAKAIQACAA